MKTKLLILNQEMFGGMASSSQAPDPQNPRNETSKLESEALWSNTHHPNILGQLDPYQDRALLKNLKVPDLMENGEVVNDSENKPIKDFPFLPRYLSSNMELFRYEAYFRMDPRLTYRDLWARMPSTAREFDLPKVRAIGMEITRKVRQRNNALCWDRKGHKLPRRNVELVDSLSQEQIELNTTWIVSSDGIRQPGQSPTLPPLPRNYFLAPGEIVHKMSVPLQNARKELRRLQKIAQRKGRDNWEDVPEDHPYQWIIRRRKDVRAREAAEAAEATRTRVREAASTLLELAAKSDDNDETESEEDYGDDTNQTSGIDVARSVQSVEPGQEGNGTNGQLMSNEANDEHDGSTQADEDMHDGSTQVDEDEVRWVARAVQSADGTFSKSRAKLVHRSLLNHYA
jgi:hypothetical protein